MELLYNNLGLIIGFLSGTFLIQTFLGEKFAEKSILLILFTMIMVNSKEFNKFIDRINDKLSDEPNSKKFKPKVSKPIVNKGVAGGGGTSW